MISSGDFFAVGRDAWERVSGFGLNPSVAYLVLARFSDRSNRVTSASVNAIETHTGISRGRAKEALGTLIKGGMILQLRGGARPQYELVLPAPTPAHGEEEPADPVNWIWLPNALVTGAAQEVPPLELMRQSQEAMALRLFVDLYRAQNLREFDGIDRRITWEKFDRVLVGQSAQYQVWGFKRNGLWVDWGNDVAKGHRRDRFTAEEKASGVNAGADFFRRMQTLASLHLVDWVPHLFESDSPEAESIHPCGMQQTDMIEDKIGLAAYQAGFGLLNDGQQARAEHEGLWVVPVPRHIANVQMIGVARLRYRPRTKLTAAWWGELQRNGNSYLERYQALAVGSSPERRVATSR